MISTLRQTCIAMLLVAMFAGMAQAQPPMPVAAEHKELAAEVGVWDAKTTMWMSPDAEPAVSNGSEENKLFGGMWLISKFQCTIAGMPYQGRGQFGYDPIAKEYVGTWIDTMSPYLSVMKGKKDASGKLVMMSKGRDPMTGKEETTKMVSTQTDNDHRTFEMYSPVPGKKDQWWKMMEIQYTRKK